MDEDELMDIHKPKPIHNWRDFLKEVGTIVLGVCIALAAEQGVEWWHWREQVGQAREAIASETAQNIAGSIRRMRTVRCTDNRLNELARILDTAARTGELPPVGYIGQPPRFMARSGAWDSVVASQTATHFSRGELSSLGSLYVYVQRLTFYTSVETEAWSSLYAMVGPGRRLDPASEAELRKALGAARNANRTMAQVASFLVTGVAAMDLPFDRDDLAIIERNEKQPLTGIKPTLGDGSPMAMICDPIGPVPASYGEAQNQASPTLVEDMVRHLPDFRRGRSHRAE
jgi:hypothetical protein